MDDKKWTFKKLLIRLILVALGFGVLLCAYGGFIFWQTQNIEDPKKCFKTKMFGVDLCSSSSNYIRYNEVPKHFFQALVLSEDGAFWSHDGFDWFEIKESFRRNILEWKYARGGSTLTQQLAKNLYLTQSKSISRKFKEFFIAKQIEEKLTKSQILEKYVNVVEFGKNIYGLKAGARHYFGKHPSQLNPLESVYLISLLPSPKRLGKSFFNKKLSSSNIWRMNIILKRMYRTNKLNENQFRYIKQMIDQSDWPFYQYDLQPTAPDPSNDFKEGLDENSVEGSQANEDDEQASADEDSEWGANGLDDNKDIETPDEDSSNKPTSEMLEDNIQNIEPEPEENQELENVEPTSFDYPEKD